MHELALSLGFADQSYMTRVFKRFTGVTPKVYRCAAKTTPPGGKPGRFRPDDKLLAFLKSL